MLKHSGPAHSTAFVPRTQTKRSVVFLSGLGFFNHERGCLDCGHVMPELSPDLEGQIHTCVL